MATLVAIAYPDETTAEEARKTVQSLESDLIIQSEATWARTRSTRSSRSRCATPAEPASDES